MQECARRLGLQEFISMQNHYNLIYREEEREMMQLLEEENVSSTPYSPLAGGRVSRMWDGDTKRSQLDDVGKIKYEHKKDEDLEIVKRVHEIANKKQVSPSQVALAWLASKNKVDSIIIGSTKIKHLEEAIDSCSIVLSKEEIAYLDELYTPHKVVVALFNNCNKL